MNENIDSQLTVRAKTDIIVPEGMMLISVAEYATMRAALIRMQQIVNPILGLDRLRTGKQRRRDARG